MGGGGAGACGNAGARQRTGKGPDERRTQTRERRGRSSGRAYVLSKLTWSTTAYNEFIAAQVNVQSRFERGEGGGVTLVLVRVSWFECAVLGSTQFPTAPARSVSSYLLLLLVVGCCNWLGEGDGAGVVCSGEHHVTLPSCVDSLRS